jgi:general secretion pathway protein J
VAVPPLDFDGQTLRLTRRSEGGVALVCWALRGGAWQRWASPIYTRSNDIRAVWMRSQQFQGAEPGQLQVAAGASEWQIYFYRGNGWSNAQSTGDQQEVAALPKAGVAAPAARPPAPDDGPGRVDGGTPPVAVLPAAAAAPVPAASPRQPMAEQLPAAVRLVITIGGKKLTRDVALGPSGS